jgi:hypothetical protein
MTEGYDGNNYKNKENWTGAPQVADPLRLLSVPQKENSTSLALQVDFHHEHRSPVYHRR